MIFVYLAAFILFLLLVWQLALIISDYRDFQKRLKDYEADMREFPDYDPEICVYDKKAER